MSGVSYIILVTLMGLVFGSFFACMGYRIPNKVSISVTRSFCPKCGKTLKWYMNIPVLSFVFLKGKCAYCKEPINYIYPFIEITTALLFLCNYIAFGFSLDFWLAIILTSALMVTIVSDFLYFYISDRVLLISGLLAIVVYYLFTDFTTVFSHIIYGIILFIVMLLIKWLGNRVFGKESLGDGDIKLMGIIGIILGLTNSFVALFIGSLLGLIFSFIIIKKNKEGIIPFGPFLLIGALMTMYFASIIGPLVEKLII